ncbi:MAG TPA: transglutaminase family protein [Gemmataceae bacterium]|nr:transglutaminase family protein [Gemmataceae bacterium]
MKYTVRHTTTYRYSKPVSLGHNIVHLAPRSTNRQKCFRSEIEVKPVPALIREETDYFGNRATYFAIEEPHDLLMVKALSSVEVAPTATPDPATTPAWESVCTILVDGRSPEGLEARQFVFDSPYVRASAELAGYAAPSFPPGRPLLAAALDLMRRIHADFRYDPRATTLTTPLPEVMSHKRGVCQDFAHLQIGCLRSLRLAARYVSGYLRTTPPPGRPRLIGADASHAWLSVWCPGCGWLDLDPTNSQAPSEGHILVAWGRDYDDVSPIKGVNLGGGRHSMTVEVDVASDDPE